jgi:hypothetical protein
MVKKIVVSVIVTLLSGGLIYGAILRTQVKSQQAGDDATSRQYANRKDSQTSSNRQVGEISDQGNQNRFGQNAERQGSQDEEAPRLRGNEKIGAEDVVSEWISIFGTVLDVSEESILVQSDQGEELIIEGMTLRYAQEQGFSTRVGNQVRLTGFYDHDAYEIGEIVDLSTGLVVSIREESGRPHWAGGRGRRGL